MRNTISLLLKGVVIGLANIIPGVSGGTMALVLGIYDRLISAASRFGVGTLVELKTCVVGPSRRETLVSTWRKYDGGFLLLLVLGAIGAVVGASWILLSLLREHPDPTFGFFFGLVAASVIVPYTLLRRKSWQELVSAVAAIALILAISTSMSGEQRVAAKERKLELEATSVETTLEYVPDHSIRNLGFLFVVGAVAISAMILPGVSGSFLLLLFGAYTTVLSAVVDVDVLALGAFGVGCLLGLSVFVKLLDFLLKRFYSPTMAFLTGLMIGSLWGLWPFKERKLVGDELIDLAHVWPSALDDTVALTILTTLLGAALVVGFHVYEQRKDRASTRTTTVNEIA